MRQPHLSRRAALAAGAVVLALTGCSAPREAGPPSKAPDTPDQALARVLIAEKQHTISLYAALIAKGSGTLAPYRERHEAHLAELRRRFPGLTPAAPSGTATPQTATPQTAAASPSAASPPAASPSAVAPKVTLSRLRGLERKAAASRPRQIAGVTPSLAQLVASIGACEALHSRSSVKAPAPPAAAGATSAADLGKLGKALAAEHAAIFAYGVLGARTTGSLRARLATLFDAHRERRDELRALITARGGRPVEPEASYALPSIPSSASAASRLAGQVESGVTAAYLELAAATDDTLRQYGAAAMQESTARAHTFAPAITAFPGMP
ncbi:ferritin-like domain-containing protein, partial [Nonomuraea sp. SBT364]|uniref:ferritin-like domain-containing protein n=1 Tax=Nonomuraea sp. SBT364 TaxID=1580530 RepID=UPI0007C7EC5C